MAVDSLQTVITAKTFPFTQRGSFNASRYCDVPWGQAIINETLETPVIGAGNTGLIVLNVALPADYVALMRNFTLQIVDTATINWKDAVVGFAYQQPGGPYKTSISDYPDDEYTYYQLVRDTVHVPDRFATPINYAMFNFGASLENSANARYFSFNDAWDPPRS